MAENYLITGYWGVPHVTSENDRGINAAIFGAGRFVLPVGEQFRSEYIGNNTVRIYDGKLIDNGAVAGIPAGEYVDLVIPEAGQGKNRNDLIIFQYSQDASTLIEKGVFMVLPGEETSGAASDPVLSQQDILTNEATLDQMALWRVPVSGTVISAPVQLFEVSKNMRNAAISIAEATSSDGVAYSATVPGITELFAGLEVTIIPNRNSASTAITLDINGFGAKNVRLPVSTNTAMLAQPDTETYFVEGRAVKLMYDTKFTSKGAWVAVDRQRQSGNDIYGTVPVEKGGTGADNAEEARENLGAVSVELVWSNASPSSAFAAQTIELDLSKYNFVVVGYRLSTGGSSYLYEWMRVRANNVTHPVYCFVNFASETAIVTYTRSAAPFSTGVKFSDVSGKSPSQTTVGAADNSRLIPYEIYGVKGVVM